jgi:23S rRNA pseudouridine1911/1915/1917 synthase
MKHLSNTSSLSSFPFPYTFKDSILAIEKPSGIAMHSDEQSLKQENRKETLADLLCTYFPQVQNIGESMITKTELEIKRPGIVHRLDQDTSGIVLIATTSEMFEHLKSAFKSRKVSKEYLAYIHGSPNWDTKTVHNFLGRSTKDFRKHTGIKELQRGEVKEAITEITVIKRFVFDKKEFALVKVQPKTGRTHQIRIHLSELGFPIISDILYGKPFKETLDFQRQALHAYRITVPSLENNKEMLTFVAKLPQDFNKAKELLDQESLKN